MPAVFQHIIFMDDAGLEADMKVRMHTDLAADGSNVAAVLAECAAVRTAATALSWAAIKRTWLEIEHYTNATPAPNDASDVKLYAFVRVEDNTTRELEYIRVPAPDMVAYEQDRNGMLDAVNWSAAILAFLGAGVDSTAGNTVAYQSAQVRTDKRRQGPRN